MLWKKTWRPETGLILAGGFLLLLFSCGLAMELLRRNHVAGFVTTDDIGSVFLATLCFHGSVLVMGTVFLKLNKMTWSEVLGWPDAKWSRHLLLAGIALLAILPVMVGLKLGSDLVLEKMHWPLHDQDAVQMFRDITIPWLRMYMGLFAVLIAPIAEEFAFRGILFSTAKKLGWPKLGAVAVSLLFALIHNSAPIFLPLFAFALMLTWLYQKTEGLWAPILAHALFNGANLALMLWAEKAGVDFH